MAKKKKVQQDNELVVALRWLMEAEPGMPRAVGVRFESESATMTLKLFECLRVKQEIVIEGVLDAKRLLREFAEEPELIPADGNQSDTLKGE